MTRVKYLSETGTGLGGKCKRFKDRTKLGTRQTYNRKSLLSGFLLLPLREKVGMRGDSASKAPLTLALSPKGRGFIVLVCQAHNSANEFLIHLHHIGINQGIDVFPQLINLIDRPALTAQHQGQVPGTQNTDDLAGDHGAVLRCFGVL